MPELYLSLEELRELVAQKKEDFQRQANQAIEKDDLKQGWKALASMEALDQFLYAASLRAGVYSPETAARHQLPGMKKKNRRGDITELPAPVPVVRKRIGGGQ